MIKYIAVERAYCSVDNIYVFDDIFRINQQYGIWNVTVYEVEIIDFNLAYPVYHDTYSTKYNNLTVGKALLQEDITDLGLLVIKDELGRVIYYYNKLNGSSRSFKYDN